VLDGIRNFCAPVLLVGLLNFLPVSQAAAEDTAVWHVSKSSGEVWMTTTGAQPASLTDEALLKPGDTIRTGPTGRVLLTRNQETILISPNSVVGLPSEQKDGLSTTIVQQAGSVLVRAEKRNVKHFQVETPYLAAVVKGTEFQVSLNKIGADVKVFGGQVQVTDFETGQFALVLPGQAAKVSASGNGGLSLSGSGKLNQIEHGSPRPSPFERVTVPKGGLAMPGDTPNGKTVHALGQIDSANNSLASADTGRGHSGLRITAPLGEVTLNFTKATGGLGHGAVMSAAEKNSAAKQAGLNNGDAAIGNSAAKANGQDTSIASNGNGNGNANGLGNGNGNANGLGNGAGNGGGGANGAANGVANGLANGLGGGNGANGNGLAVGIALGNGKAKGHEK